MNAEKTNKLLKVKHNFDRLTSQNSQNWQLVLFWIVVFELSASILEYFTFENSASFVMAMPESLTKEFFIGVAVTTFVWGCIYNFVFGNKTLFLWMVLFAMTGMYMMVTHDMTFNFVLHNLEPTHFMNANLSLELVLEILFKLIITYLIYQLIVSLRNRKRT